MIAIASPSKKTPSRSKPASAVKKAVKVGGRLAASARLPGAGVAKKKAKAPARRTELQRLRDAFFERPIEFISCKEFSRKNAEQLASTPPADAVVPLEQRGHKGVADGPISPYIARLYDSRLLTKDEEQFYFRRMNWLKFTAAKVRRSLDRQRVTRRQMQQVEALLDEAEQVKALIITANLRLVVSIAKKFVSAELLFEDLVSEGNLALMRSVEKFNFALGNRFSTYATYAIQRHFYRLSQRSRKQWNRFVSDDTALHALSASERDPEMCTSGQIDVLKETFSQFLEELEPREKQIVVARFGFDGQAPRTFRELGTQMGVCKERIRQIQGRAMDKLRVMAEEARLEQTVGDWL